MFEWSGLQQKQYLILKQVSNPLKYCNYSIPIPLGIGLPFMPCDLPNQYTLHQSNQSLTYQGDIYLTFEQQVSLIQRLLIPASHRPWKMIGKDYYNHTPYVGIRQFNICFVERPQVKVYCKDRYVGKVMERTIINCCCVTKIWQQFQIFNQRHELLYRVQSSNPQNGHFLILPCCGFDQITYDILRIQSISQELDQIQDRVEDVYNLVQGQKAGQIIHMWNGCDQYTSKNDKYGIKLPQDCSEQHKCLLIHCTLFIDYLLFQNF